jgi:hypothetical protein
MKFTDYGCYPIAYVMDDGEALCADCMNDPTNPVHSGGEADGWRFEGIDVIEDPECEAICAHCGNTL